MNALDSSAKDPLIEALEVTRVLLAYCLTQCDLFFVLCSPV